MSAYSDKYEVASKSSEELLAQLLTEAELLAVLRYSKEHGLESDDAVFFLVALLKVYASAHDRILGTIGEGRDMLVDVTDRGDQVVRKVERMLDTRTATLVQVIDGATDRLAFHVGEIRAGLSDLRLLKDELDRTKTEAMGVYRAYNRLTDDAQGMKLSQLFQKAAVQALDRRVPFFDDTIKSLLVDTIAERTRKFTIVNGVMFVVMAAIIVVVAR